MKKPKCDCNAFWICREHATKKPKPRLRRIGWVLFHGGEPIGAVNPTMPKALQYGAYRWVEVYANPPKAGRK